MVKSLDQVPGLYAAIEPLPADVLAGAVRVVGSCVPAVEVPGVLLMLGLVEA